MRRRRGGSQEWSPSLELRTGHVELQSPSGDDFKCAEQSKLAGWEIPGINDTGIRET